jgi:hypothetical protein
VHSGAAAADLQLVHSGAAAADLQLEHSGAAAADLQLVTVILVYVQKNNLILLLTVYY